MFARKSLFARFAAQASFFASSICSKTRCFDVMNIQAKPDVNAHTVAASTACATGEYGAPRGATRPSTLSASTLNVRSVVIRPQTAPCRSATKRAMNARPPSPRRGAGAPVNSAMANASAAVEPTKTWVASTSAPRQRRRKTTKAEVAVNARVAANRIAAFVSVSAIPSCSTNGKKSRTKARRSLARRTASHPWATSEGCRSASLARTMRASAPIGGLMVSSTAPRANS